MEMYLFVFVAYILALSGVLLLQEYNLFEKQNCDLEKQDLINKLLSKRNNFKNR